MDPDILLPADMRVLIISPHFPPANAADMQRVRMLLPYFGELGVYVEVLAVSPEQANCPTDLWLEEGLPKDVPIHRVEALSLRWTKIPGFGTLGFRALRALAKRGDRLLADGAFDLVYFSTTVFEVHILGARWKKKFCVPFIMDYQDPWVNDYYREHPEVDPPGGWLKHRVIDFMHRRMEPKSLRACGGITSVSPAYPRQLEHRYPWWNRPNLVIPFPGDIRDQERAADDSVEQSLFNRSDGMIHWVYAGVFINAMHGTARALFRSLRDCGLPELIERLRIHCMGTCYGTGRHSTPVITPIAEEYGLEGCVDEHPARIPYSQVLACLQDADALLVIGSNDSGYTASKLYPYILARKPLLTIFHQDSSVVSLMKKFGGGVCVPFDDETSEDQLASSINKAWLRESKHTETRALNEDAFAPFTAQGQSEQLSEFFRSVVGSQVSQPD